MLICWFFWLVCCLLVGYWFITWQPGKRVGNIFQILQLNFDHFKMYKWTIWYTLCVTPTTMHLKLVIKNTLQFSLYLQYFHFPGLKVLLDFVPNHASIESEYFLESVKRNPEYEDYFIWADPVWVDPDNATNRLPPSNWVSRTLIENVLNETKMTSYTIQTRWITRQISKELTNKKSSKMFTSKYGNSCPLIRWLIFNL